ncbi:MAG TPA: hypothetical protein DCW60_03860 [Sutterella sp.]|nr:hypothetical protein [Sutterella sp.]
MDLPVTDKPITDHERVPLQDGITLRTSPYYKKTLKADEVYVFEKARKGVFIPDACVLMIRKGKLWTVKKLQSPGKLTAKSRLKAEKIALLFTLTTDPDQNFRDTLLKENQRNQKKNIQPSNF